MTTKRCYVVCSISYKKTVQKGNAKLAHGSFFGQSQTNIILSVNRTSGDYLITFTILVMGNVHGKSIVHHVKGVIYPLIFRLSSTRRSEMLNELDFVAAIIDKSWIE